MGKFAAMLALACALGAPAMTQGYQEQSAQVRLVEYQSPLLPPANYKSQWWTSPDSCQYSRAGRPGETVWYLIVNTAHEKCKKRLIQRAFSDYN